MTYTDKFLKDILKRHLALPSAYTNQRVGIFTKFELETKKNRNKQPPSNPHLMHTR
jgi:hypothetical protein